VNEQEMYMMRQEIVELNRTIDRINRKSDKWLEDLTEAIDYLRTDMNDNATAITKLSNAIERAFKVVVEVKEDYYD
jgi:predicted  nucleic acid-binding Zn-ribbon protein